MINTSRIIRIDNFNGLALAFVFMSTIDLCHTIAFRNL